MNLHLNKKFNIVEQKSEVEKLYQQINNKRNELIIEDEEKLKCDLKRFGLQNQKSIPSNVINKTQLEKIKQLRNNKNITIRKADKSNTYVIMNAEDYTSKLNNLVHNEKFEETNLDLIDNIKKEANTLIQDINKSANKIIFKPLIGSFKPGYIYGAPKIHKNINDPPLRPIVSTIPTPTYEISKTLNNIIISYMPNTYSIGSSKEFIAILSGYDNKIPFNNIMASLDVESLYTNVPLEEAINVALTYVYENEKMPPPDISKENLKKLLFLCTSGCPFQTPDKKCFIQKNGVMMGCVLGPTLANFYMGHLENLILNSILKQQNKEQPFIYCRYIDDIFLTINSEADLINLKNLFEEYSVLKFTYEIENHNKIKFLDCEITKNYTALETKVYVKETFDGNYLNYNSICPIRYKTGIIKTLLHRAKLISSNWSNFHVEITRLKQTLVNNNYPLFLIDKEINNFLKTNFEKNISNSIEKNKINLFFKNQMTDNYQQREKQIKNILYKNLKSKNEETKISLMIYYKNLKLKDISLTPKQVATPFEDQANVVYQYQCPHNGCKTIESFYIGYTTNTLKTRMTQHFTSGAIRKHHELDHGFRPTKESILKNTKIIDRAPCREDLMLKEALYIKQIKPIINKKDEGIVKTLKIF